MMNVKTFKGGVIMRFFNKVFFLSVLITFSSCSDLSSCSPANKDNRKNLIYIIGDGMGFNHIENTKTYLGKKSFFFENYYTGSVATHSADQNITDSAAAATALATGVKTNNKYLGVNPNCKKLQNIMELSNSLNRKTGIITTDSLWGATPAGFSAHHNTRDEIQPILDDQSVSNIDLLFGLHNTTYQDQKQKFINNGYNYLETLEELNSASKENKIIGNFKNINSKYNIEINNPISLKELVTYSLDYFSSFDSAFTLMVEGAYVDKHSHSNNLLLMLYAMQDLYDATEYIFDWASKNMDTVIIFTADHETGGLKKANSKEELTNDLYTSVSHTASNVPLYLYNAEFNSSEIDNTDIFKIAKDIVINHSTK